MIATQESKKMGRLTLRTSKRKMKLLNDSYILMNGIPKLAHAVTTEGNK